MPAHPQGRIVGLWNAPIIVRVFAAPAPTSKPRTPAQLAAKQADARRLLAAYPHLSWLEPVASDEAHFRNKAKLVVGGSAQNPSLGIVDYRSGRATDLSECPLYIEPIERVIPVLHELIQRADLTPYDIPARRGELKNILVTASETGELMVRFVLRSKKLLVPIRRQLGVAAGASAELGSAVGEPAARACGAD